MPRFSIVVPAYNAEATLAETLAAILLQTLDDWECVIVDDGSADDTASIADEYCDTDPRFRLVQQDNRGAAGAYRTGVAAAEADLLVICAADDLLLPDHLKVMSQLTAENPEYDIYSCNGEYLYHETGDRRPVYNAKTWTHERSLSFEQVLEGCFYSVGAVVRRAVFEMTGGHRDGVYVDDYDLWLRAMVRGARHLYTPRVLSVHRVSEFQQTADLSRVFESNIEVYEHLAATEDLTESQLAAVRAGIKTNRERMAHQSEYVAMEQQGRVLRRRVERLVGPKWVEPVLHVIHSVSWMTRPARRLVTRLTGQRTK